MSFERAAEVFFDPFAKLVEASRNDEAREALIGVDFDLNLLLRGPRRLRGRDAHSHHLSPSSEWRRAQSL